MKRLPRLARRCSLFALAVLFSCVATRAQQSPFGFSVAAGQARFMLETNTSVYYLLEQSTDLKQFAPVELSLGSLGPQWQLAATNAHAFFVLTPVSIYAPRVSLGDGVDDLFKLNNGLNPLDPSLADSDSGFRGADGMKLSWLDYYHQHFGRPAPVSESLGREYSVFNAGAPSAVHEALSREFSLYNGGALPRVAIPQEAYSREASLFNFGSSTLGNEAVSREVSLFFTIGVPNASAAIASREVSVFNGQDEPRSAIQEAYSRELAVFNSGAPTAASEALSREISIFNNVLN